MQVALMEAICPQQTLTETETETRALNNPTAKVFSRRWHQKRQKRFSLQLPLTIL